MECCNNVSPTIPCTALQCVELQGPAALLLFTTDSSPHSILQGSQFSTVHACSTYPSTRLCCRVILLRLSVCTSAPPGSRLLLVLLTTRFRYGIQTQEGGCTHSLVIGQRSQVHSSVMMAHSLPLAQWTRHASSGTLGLESVLQHCGTCSTLHNCVHTCTVEICTYNRLNSVVLCSFCE